MSWKSFFTKQKKQDLDEGLEKTKKSFFSKIANTVAGKSKIDEEVLDNLEEVLVSSDVSVKTTLKIIDRLEKRVKKDKYVGVSELNEILKTEISEMLSENNIEDITGFDTPSLNEPYVIMVVGVNGVGKTTTIGKLAHQFKNNGKNVVLGAADTFRAAAVEQLTIWSERVGVPIVKQQMGSDPASVSFDTLQSAKAGNADVVLIDTAGRLHNKNDLMNELSKIIRVIKKIDEDFPTEIVLVLDGNIGQNSVKQAEVFKEICDIDSIIITKLDGTAKGGVLIPIAQLLNLPISFIGTGEQKEDLINFKAKEYTEALLDLS